MYVCIGSDAVWVCDFGSWGTAFLSGIKSEFTEFELWPALGVALFNQYLFPRPRFDALA